VPDGTSSRKAKDSPIADNLRLSGLPTYEPQLNQHKHVWDEVAKRISQPGVRSPGRGYPATGARLAASSGRLESVKRVVRMARSHGEFLPNWFRARGEISSTAVEDLNNEIR